MCSFSKLASASKTETKYTNSFSSDGKSLNSRLRIVYSFIQTTILDYGGHFEFSNYLKKNDVVQAQLYSTI